MEPGTGRRAIVYCIVPAELADRLHEPLRRHFATDPSVAVVVEQRWRDRRRSADRRETASASADERRRIRAEDGRRVADRRASTVAVDPRELPRVARRHAAKLVFVERLEPSSEQLEDRDTARLVSRFQAGEADVFADLYLRYFDRVYAYLRTVLNDPHGAEDLAQQVFTQVLEALPRYERRTQPFRAWLFRIVRNCALGRLSERRRLEVEEHAPLDVVDARPDADDGQLDALSWVSDPELVMFIERLPLPQRQVILLRYMLDLTYRQIAAILGRSEDDVRALQYRALRFLRQRLNAIGRTSTRGRRVPMHRMRQKSNLLRARRFVLLR